MKHHLQLRKRRAALGFLVPGVLVIAFACLKIEESKRVEGPMAASDRLVLHPELEKYRDRIEASIKPFVRVTGTAGPTKPWESKFAGDPYFPKGAVYPLDEKGRPMKLIAQINFEEAPDIGLFPKTGILEFFISPGDEVYGCNFDHPTEPVNFRIVYFKSVEKDPARLVRDFSFVTVGEEDYFPVPKEARLTFAVGYEPVSINDYQFRKYIAEDFFKFFKQFGKHEDEVLEFYADNFSSNGHKLGGYAFFTQTDPRGGTLGDHEVLLLQIDTDDGLEIKWGDAGVANFFIKKKDLEKLRFTEVLYNWDCY